MRHDPLWKWFEALPKKTKATAQSRMEAIELFFHLLKAGVPKGHASSAVAKRLGISKSTLSEWRKLIEGVSRENWLPALAPKYAEPSAGVPHILPQDVALTAFCDSWHAMDAKTRAKALNRIGVKRFA